MTTVDTESSALSAEAGSAVVSAVLPLAELIIVIGLVISPGAAAV